jgi:DNA/RNA endonuclease G (NUC1)
VTEELRRSIDLDPDDHCAAEDQTQTEDYLVSALRSVAPEEFAASRAAPETIAELARAMDPNDGGPRGNLPVPTTAPNVLQFPGFPPVVDGLGNSGPVVQHGAGNGASVSSPVVVRYGHRPPFGLPAAPVVLERLYYTLGFDPGVRLMRWAAFTIDTPATTIAVRRAEYRFDPEIPEALQTGDEAYRNNPYDRASMVRRSDSLIGGTPEMNARLEEEAFYFSVTVPQPDVTNRRTWLAVEQFASNLSRTVGPIHTVAGPIFPQSDTESGALLVIGPQLTLVPIELFRVHLRDTVEGWRSIAFVVPNDGMAVADPSEFVTSVAEVERLTGLTFFPDLDPADEAIKENADLDAFVAPAPRNAGGLAPVDPDDGAETTDRTCDTIPWDDLGAGSATLDLQRLDDGRSSASQTVRLSDRPGFHVLTVARDQPGRYSVTLSSSTSDPTLAIFRIGDGDFPPDCEFLQFNDDGGGGLNSRIEIDLEPGRYVLQTGRFPNSARGSAELNIAPVSGGTDP